MYLSYGFRVRILSGFNHCKGKACRNAYSGRAQVRKHFSEGGVFSSYLSEVLKSNGIQWDY